MFAGQGWFSGFAGFWVWFVAVETDLNGISP
jgi:hypothetical protein